MTKLLLSIPSNDVSVAFLQIRPSSVACFLRIGMSRRHRQTIHSRHRHKIHRPHALTWTKVTTKRTTCPRLPCRHQRPQTIHPSCSTIRPNPAPRRLPLTLLPSPPPCCLAALTRLTLLPRPPPCCLALTLLLRCDHLGVGSRSLTYYP